MTISAFILTAEERGAAIALNDGGGVAVDPVPINNPAAGASLGKYLVPARVANDPDYSRWHDFLVTLQPQDVDPQALFLAEQMA